jgi:hypothetical protein
MARCSRAIHEALKCSSKPFNEALTQQGRDDNLEGLLICGIDFGGAGDFHELFPPAPLPYLGYKYANQR